MPPRSTAIKPAAKGAKATRKTARVTQENDNGMRVLKVYLDNGVVFEYDLPAHKVREHSAAIVKDGYRHNNGIDEYEHYGPHRIDKVKVEGLVPTKYPDRQGGT